MIGAYLESVAGRPDNPAAGEAAQEDISIAFMDGLRFLADPQGFHHAATNIVAGGMDRAISDHQILPVIAPSPGLSVGYSQVYSCLAVIPEDYHHRVQKNPTQELGALLLLSEMVRPIMAHNVSVDLHGKPVLTVAEVQERLIRLHPRGNAREADFVRLLDQSGTGGQKLLEHYDRADELLAQYPKGFAGLPPELTHLRTTGITMPELNPTQIDQIVKLEAGSRYHTAAGGYHLETILQAGNWASAAAIEQTLRAVDSAVHLHAVDYEDDETFAFVTLITAVPDTTPEHACAVSAEAYNHNMQQLSTITTQQL